MPLTPDEISLLGFLREHGPTSVNTLARLSYEEKSEIKRHLHELESRSLITEITTEEYKVIDFKER